MAKDILITPASGQIDFSDTGAASTISLQVRANGDIDFEGSAGNLFTISDSLTGSLMSVSDVSGLPILEVFDTDKVVMGAFGSNTLVVNGDKVSISADVNAGLAHVLQINGQIGGPTFSGTYIDLVSGNAEINGNNGTLINSTTSTGINAIYFDKSPNAAHFFGSGVGAGSGSEVITIVNATTNPSTNPTGGGIMYVDGGDSSKLKWRVPGGTVYTLSDTYSTDIHANIAALDLVSGTNTGDQSATLTAGYGLSGTTYDPDTSTTFDLDFTELNTSILAAADDLIFYDTSTTSERKQVVSSVRLSQFDNDSGWTDNAGIVESLTTTGTSGAATLIAGVLNVPQYTDTTYSATLIAGNGLSGTTYTPSTSTTFALDFDELALGGTLVGTDWLIASNGGVESRQVISSIPLSIFNDDLTHPNTATAADDILEGSNSGTEITYSPYTARTTGTFYYNASNPISTANHLKYDGEFSPTRLYLPNAPDTALAATHYYVETGGANVLPKTLANVRTEIVTTAAVDAAKSDIVTGTGTNDYFTLWNGTNAINAAQYVYQDTLGEMAFVNQNTGADPLLFSSSTTQTLSLTGNLAVSATLTLGTDLGATYGGTGIGTYATGDILYASASNTLSKLAAGTNTHVLTLVGGVPQWQAPAANYTFTNGLSESGGTVKLGAALTEDTTIDGGGYALAFGDTGTRIQDLEFITGGTSALPIYFGHQTQVPASRGTIMQISAGATTAISDGMGGGIFYNVHNGTGNLPVGYFRWSLEDITASSEDGKFEFSIEANSAIVDALAMEGLSTGDIRYSLQNGNFANADGSDKIMFVDGATGDITNLGIGSGLSVNGSNLDAIGSGGNVSNTGTPLNNQVAIWTDATTIEGDSNLTFDGTTLSIGTAGTKLLSGDLTLDAGATGNPRLDFAQNSVNKAWLQYADTGDNLIINNSGGGGLLFTISSATALTVSSGSIASLTSTHTSGISADDDIITKGYADSNYASNTNYYLTAASYAAATSVFTFTVSGATNPILDISNSIYADALAVSGDGTTSQYLRSDGDGTFSWVSPPNTNYYLTALGFDTGTGVLTGTVSGASNPTVDLDGRYAYYDHVRSTGADYLTSTTTAALITELEGDGMFDSYVGFRKTGWSYAGNGDLTDGGPTELAGSSWITWTDNSSDSTRGNITALFIAPNSGGSAKQVWVYNDQGASYSPGWHQIVTTSSGNAPTATSATSVTGSNVINASHLNVSGNGTSSQYLRSDGDGTFTWATPSAEVSDGNSVLKIKRRSFTASEIRNMNSTSITIVSGVTGHMYSLISASMTVGTGTAFSSGAVFTLEDTSGNIQGTFPNLSLFFTSTDGERINWGTDEDLSLSAGFRLKHVTSGMTGGADGRVEITLVYVDITV